jgi:hypothetical protein
MHLPIHISEESSHRINGEARRADSKGYEHLNSAIKVFIKGLLSKHHIKDFIENMQTSFKKLDLK